MVSEFQRGLISSDRGEVFVLEAFREEALCPPRAELGSGFFQFSCSHLPLFDLESVYFNQFGHQGYYILR